jgi:Outer membrane protein beta-barrel domain
MKNIVLTFLGTVFVSGLCFAQQQKQKKAIGLGLKTGYNFVKVTGASAVNATNTNGFHFGAFYSPGQEKQKGWGYRTELIYSRQGYNFEKGTTTGNVKLDYILLPQLTTFKVSKFFQVQLGAQIAFLINAQADSMATNSSASNAYSKVADYYNKIDYGFAGGVEVHPIEGLMVGARLNISLANANKEIATGVLYPSFIPTISGANLKNNVLQIFAGWRF